MTIETANFVPVVPETPATSVKPTSAVKGLSASEREVLEEALGANLNYVKNDLFKKPSAEKELFAPGKAITSVSTSWYRPMLDDDLLGSNVPNSSLLDTDQEKLAFLRYNYARKRAQEAVAKFNKQPARESARQVVRWYSRVRETRDVITQTNLALVLAMAKRTRMNEVDFGELVSEGNMALLRAIEKFDIARGFKFSTYACRAILKGFSRIAVKTSRYRQAFPAEYDPALEKSDFLETRRAESEKDAVEELQRIMGENRAHLSDVEKTVLQARFALSNVADPAGLPADASSAPMTLEEVGQVIGVTKERVRQIQNKALEKLRAAMEEDPIRRRLLDN